MTDKLVFDPPAPFRVLRWPVAVLRPWGLEAPYSRFVARALDRIASAEPLTEKSAARWWRLRS